MITQQLLERDATFAPPAGWATRFVRNLSVQDWWIGVYFGLLLVAVTFGTGPARAESAKLVGIDLSVFAVAVVLTRGGVLKHGSFANGIVYRLSVFLAVFLSYFQLRTILPAVSSRALDADILAFDLRVFGFEPSVAWDAFVTPVTTEWFAFFYFGYFFFLMAHIFPMMLVARDKAMLAHFSFGIFIVFCTGHLVYMIVPGWGPYHHLAGQFHNELRGGVFWGLVKEAVEVGGAQKDIFPSLHTAAPTFFALFSFRYRARTPFKYTWLPMAFFASQIIGATMFLRWHYLIDIFAGMTLAATALFVSGRVMAWERRRREAWGVTPTFTPLEYPWTKTSPRRD